MSKSYLFTSESVSEGHPDKMADQVSDAILDAILAQEPKSRVACETMTKTGMVIVAGEITTNAVIEVEHIVRKTVLEIGYDHSDKGFDGTTCAVLNGLGAEEIVREHGSWPIVSGVTFMSGTKHSDTHVEYILDTETWLGPYENTPFERAQEIADRIVEAGLRAEALPDLRPAQWSKLIFNAAVNPVAALTGLPHDPHFAAEAEPGDLGHLVHGLVDEGKAVATAAGVALHDDPWEMNVHATQRGSAHYPSMLEDVDARRPTEIELITGSILREADRQDVPVPLHAALHALVQDKEASW